MRVRGAQATEIEALYRTRFRVFVASVTALLRDGDEALDVVQEAFGLALRRRRSFRGNGALEAWIWRIVLNKAYDRMRSRRLATRGELTHAVTTSSGVDEHDELRVLLYALPERQRVAVFLRYYADLSYSQIAAALGVSPGTVAASLNHAHNALRQELEEVVR